MVLQNLYIITIIMSYIFAKRMTLNQFLKIFCLQLLITILHLFFIMGINLVWLLYLKLYNQYRGDIHHFTFLQLRQAMPILNCFLLLFQVLITYQFLFEENLLLLEQFYKVFQLLVQHLIISLYYVLIYLFYQFHAFQKQ